MLESLAIDIRVLQRSDIAAALRLKELAGWNQTEQDWQRLLRLEPRGCFCATSDGRVIGTSTTTTYGFDLAWIGMVLVDPEYRKRGIGKRLMQVALDYLRDIDVSTVKLDATPDGRPVYEGMGFKVESRVERWQGVALPNETSVCKSLSTAELADLFVLDRAAFGADRSTLIEILITDACVTPLVSCDANGKVIGYALARPGSNATYIGPLIASAAQQAEQLLDGLLAQLTNQEVYVDLNTEFENGTEILSKRGFVKQRNLDRMCYGKSSD
ncbi:MAG TPA: GNAT family N-acetyltransferase, partial [Pyrinomonadaceae bacterium]